MKGFVDRVSLNEGILTIRGWAVDNLGRLPPLLTIRIKGETIQIDRYLKQDRPDVKKYLGISSEDVGFLFEIKTPRIDSLNKIGTTIEVYSGHTTSSLQGPLAITQKVAERIVFTKHALISCIFGTRFSRIYQSVAGRDCFFFSNNASLEDEAVSKGWRFRLVDPSVAPLTHDIRTSSIQAKQIKFLQFFDQFPELKSFEVFTYFDHKFFVQEKHLLWIINNTPPNSSALIRATSAIKSTIGHEISVAMRQKRYSAAMDQTIAWLDYLKINRGISDETRICNTGLIHYQNIPAITPMLKEIYETVVELQQPECQIIWAALSQDFKKHIHTVDWISLKPTWKAP